jgi:hypothetical protein
MPTTLDTRFENFTNAYLELGYEPDEAAELGAERLAEDDDTCFKVYACTDYSTAKESMWLLEAVSRLCAGDLHNDEALYLIDKARKSLQRK